MHRCVFGLNKGCDILSFSLQCSVSCGKGLQLRVVKCTEKDVAGKYKELSPKKCQHVPKPSMELQRTCVMSDCPVLSPHSRADWYSSPWSQAGLLSPYTCLTPPIMSSDQSVGSLFLIFACRVLCFPAVYGVVWRRGSGALSAVSRSWASLFWVCPADEASDVSGL